MDRNYILIREVPKYYETHLLNLFLILFIAPDNCLIDENKTNLSSKKKLKILSKRKINKLIVTHFNISSLRKKFDSLGQISS